MLPHMQVRKAGLRHEMISGHDKSIMTGHGAEIDGHDALKYAPELNRRLLASGKRKRLGRHISLSRVDDTGGAFSSNIALCQKSQHCLYSDPTPLLLSRAEVKSRYALRVTSVI